MTMIRFAVLSLLLALCVACSKPAPDAVTPAPSAQAQQALSWLTTPARWLVDEARENNTLLFKRGIQQIGDGDMGIEWVRFLPNGRFEAKMLHESTLTTLFFKLNDGTSELWLSGTATFTSKRLGSAAYGMISDKQVIMQMNEGSGDQITLTLIPQP